MGPWGWGRHCQAEGSRQEQRVKSRNPGPGGTGFTAELTVQTWVFYPKRRRRELEPKVRGINVAEKPGKLLRGVKADGPEGASWNRSAGTGPAGVQSPGHV